MKLAYVGCHPGLLPCLFCCRCKRAFSDSLFPRVCIILWTLAAFLKQGVKILIGGLVLFFCSSSNNKGIISFICLHYSTALLFIAVVLSFLASRWRSMNTEVVSTNEDRPFRASRQSGWWLRRGQRSKHDTWSGLLTFTTTNNQLFTRTH